MIFTKNMILTESAFCNDYTRITTALDMMCESFFTVEESDDQLLLEAGEKSLSSIKSAVKTLLEKLKAFVKKCADELRIQIAKKKYKDLMTPKNLEILKKAKAGKIKGPNIKQQIKVLKEYEKFVDKFTDEGMRYIEKYRKDPSDTLRDKFMKFCDAGVDKSDEFVKRIQSYDKNTVLTVSEAIEAIKYKDEMVRGYDRRVDIIQRIDSKINTILNDFSEVLGESVEVYSYMDDYVKNPLKSKKRKRGLRGAITGIKEMVTKFINSIHTFCYRHYKICSTILHAISIICTILTPVFGQAAKSTLANAKSKDPSFDEALKETKSALGYAGASIIAPVVAYNAEMVAKDLERKGPGVKLAEDVKRKAKKTKENVKKAIHDL